MDDLDVTPTAPSNVGGVDPLFKQMYGDGTGDEVAERRVGFPVIPPFTHYHLKPTKAGLHRTSTNVGARASVEVLEGPEDTKGFKFADSGDVAYGFIVSKETGKPGQRVALGDEEYAKKCGNRRRLLNRVRQVLGLSMATPPGSFSDAAVNAYCAQFSNAKSFIAEVRVERGQDGQDRNRIIWESIAAPDEEERDRKGNPTGKTALQFAREKIAAYKAKPAPGGGGNAASSGDLS